MHTQTEPAESLSQILLEHVARYQVSNWGALKRVVALRRVSDLVLERTLSRLVARRHFKVASSHYSHRVWRLRDERRGYRASWSTKVEPPSSTLRDLAMLTFCCRSVTPRSRLFADELHSLIDGNTGLTHRTRYYQQLGATEPRIGFMRVIAPQHSLKRVVAQLHRDLKRHATSPSWQPLVASGRLEIAVLVGSQSDADWLRRHINFQSGQPIPLRIAVVPLLDQRAQPPPAA